MTQTVKVLKATTAELLAMINVGRHIGNAANAGLTYNWPESWTRDAKETLRESMNAAACANRAVLDRSDITSDGDHHWDVMQLEVLED
jgi:hypothetical protein